MRQLLREPLLHFLLLGIGLFVAYSAVTSHRGGGGQRIVITDATVSDVVRSFTAAWQRPPTPLELRGLLQTRINEEALVREGIRLGLDRDDPVIRRRVLQKLKVLTEESGPHTAPSDAELGAYLARHADRYATAAAFEFDQILFEPTRHGARLDADVSAALGRLRSGAPPAALGDPSLLSAHTPMLAADLVGRDFGDDFAAALARLPVGSWEGPVTSGFGVHLVRVLARTEGVPATLATVRDAVSRDWENERRTSASAAYEERLRRSYRVVIEARLPAGASPVP